MNHANTSSMEHLFAGVSFFNELKRQDPQQWELLIKHCDIRELAPGEVLIQRNEVDPSLYFLLRGQLAVFADNHRQRSEERRVGKECSSRGSSTRERRQVT